MYESVRREWIVSRGVGHGDGDGDGEELFETGILE